MQSNLAKKCPTQLLVVPVHLIFGQDTISSPLSQQVWQVEVVPSHQVQLELEPSIIGTMTTLTHDTVH